MDTNELISVKEATHLLGVTRSAIHRAINQNRLETIRVGSTRFLVRASVIAYKPRADAGKPRGKKKQEGGENG